jgi:hypothetical protein
MTPQKLADEILPQVEEAYKETVLRSASELAPEEFGQGSLSYKQSKLGDIRVIVPIPLAYLEDIPVEDVAKILRQHEFVASVEPYHRNTIRDNSGKIMMDLRQDNLVALEVICKPLRDVRLA